MMAQDGYVQVLPDGTGKKVRNLSVTQEIYNTATGAWESHTVLMQVVSIADERGNLLDLGGAQEAMLVELTQIRELLELFVGGH